MEVDAGQVLRLLMQFLQENGLRSSLSALQEETGVSLNLLERPDVFAADCAAGRWDAVLAALSTLKLPSGVLQLAYEVIIFELVEARELDAARAVLRGVLPMALLRSEDGDAYASLEALVSRGSSGSAAQAYAEGGAGSGSMADAGGGGGGGGGGSGGAAALQALQAQPRAARRAALASAVLAHTSTAPPSRLLTLLSQALKWQVHTGQLPAAAALAGGPPDLLCGGVQARRIDDSLPVAGRPGGLLVAYGAGPLRPGAALLTPSGACLVVGGGDGLIEVFDASGGFGEASGAPCAPRLSPLCPYQAADEFMVHQTGITALTASGDGEVLASASADGVIKVWRLATGECLRSFAAGAEAAGAAGAAAVLALAFSRDASALVSAGLDGVVRVWGLRSGKGVCEMRGHASHVTGVVLMLEEAGGGARVVSAGADGTVRLWDAGTGAAIGVLLGGRGSGGGSLSTLPPIYALAALPAVSTAFPASAGAFFVLRAPPVGPGAGAGAGAKASAATAAAAAAAAEEAQGQDPSPCLLLLSAARNGAVLQAYALPPHAPRSDAHASFSALAVSPTGKFVYAGLCEGSRAIYGWEVATGAAVGGVGRSGGAAAHDKGVAGLAAHPIRPVLVSWGEEGVLKSWV